MEPNDRMIDCYNCLHRNVCKYREILKIKSPLTRGSQCKHFKNNSKFIEQKYGFWLKEEDCYGDPVYQCSNCGMYFVLIEGTPEENEYDYCPSCGAIMNKRNKQIIKERKENGY